MVTAKTQYNLKNAREYFEEHLCVGDYYNEGQRVSIGAMRGKSVRLTLDKATGDPAGEHSLTRIVSAIQSMIEGHPSTPLLKAGRDPRQVPLLPDGSRRFGNWSSKRMREECAALEVTRLAPFSLAGYDLPVQLQEDECGFSCTLGPRPAGGGLLPSYHPQDQREVRTAPNRNESKQFFTVIHPFHPWRGQRFELVDLRRRSGDWRVFYINKQGNNSSLPASWTDAVVPELFIEISQGRAIARVRDLVQLAELAARCVSRE